MVTGASTARLSVGDAVTGLLRQYLPKGTDLARYTQTQLNAIAREAQHPCATGRWASPCYLSA